MINGRLIVRGHIIEAKLSNWELKLIGDDITIPKWVSVLDYNTSLQGPGHVEDGELVFCLNIGKDVHQISSLILRCISEEKQVYERIGLARLPFFKRDAQEFHPDWDVFGPEQGTRELHFEREIPKHKEIYFVEEQKMTGARFTDSLESVDIHYEKDWEDMRTTIAELTTEQAAEAKQRLGVRKLSKKKSVPINDPKDAKWFLSPQNAERKARGEKYWRYYLGKVVTIV